MTLVDCTSTLTLTHTERDVLQESETVMSSAIVSIVLIFPAKPSSPLLAFRRKLPTGIEGRVPLTICRAFLPHHDQSIGAEQGTHTISHIFLFRVSD